jgi:hypothetical protein
LHRLFLAPALVLILATAAVPASSQTRPPDQDATVYPAAFFADAQPQNALDMLDRVPGFTLQEGDTVRGFGGAAGNVLVDGTRPATKDVSLSDVLRRIPAASVDRIELRDGSSAGLQGAGSRLIANVVRRTTTRSGGTWRVRTERTARDRYAPYVASTWAGTIRGTAVSASAEGGISFVSTQDGSERLFDGAGALIESGPLIDLRRAEAAAASLGLSRSIAGMEASLAVSLRREEGGRRSRFDVFLPGMTIADRIELEDDGGGADSAEVSLELRRQVGPGEAKLIGLRSSVESHSRNQVGQQFSSGAFAATRFTARDVQSETILRGSWGPRWSTIALDFGLEGAWTRLESDTLFSLIDDRGSTPVEIGRTEVSEARGSAEASATFSGLPQWTFETAVAAESSEIVLDAPLSSSRRYTFFKPRLAATWRPSPSLTLSLRAERRVGQLDFSDFVGAQQISDGTATQTNADLQPPQTDDIRLSLEKRWGERGAVSVTLVDERIRDVVDVIPIGRGQGIGNLPSASRRGADLQATVPLDFLVDGAEVVIDAAWRETSVRDPFNGQIRPLQQAEHAPATVSYRHVLSPTFTFGGTVRITPVWRTFRSNLSIDFQEGPASLSLFAETTAWRGLKARLEVNRAFGSDIHRELSRFAGIRGVAPLSSLEIRDRVNRPELALQIEGRF